MSTLMWLIIASGILAIVYGAWAVRSILAADAGNERMQEIASAIQLGASAYLNRQYTTIGVVGVIIAIIVFFLLGLKVSIGFVVGATLSGIAGYIGMLGRFARMFVQRKQLAKVWRLACRWRSGLARLQGCWLLV